MSTKEYTTASEQQQNPWVQTPLRESYALSEAAGWYGHTASSHPHNAPIFPRNISMAWRK
jgi:hypothetical protein